MQPSRAAKDEIDAVFSAILLDNRLVRAPPNQPPPRHTRAGLTACVSPHNLF